MKRIYLVRHGESEANVSRNHGSPSTPLTDTGRVQAQYIAERISKLPIQKMIASSMLRAQQTAEIISQKNGLGFVTSDLFVETSGPTEFIGTAFDYPPAVEAYKELGGKYGKAGFRLGDAEVFEDHTKRAQAALQFLVDQEEENLLVVSHGLFKRILAAHVLHGPAPTGEECRKVMQRLGDRNTGLTIFEYGVSDYLGNELEYPWRLVVWNDHAHLG